MYGNIGIVQGNYNFSLQQLIHKNFKIRDGSIINFRGDPFEATMNVNAIYNVTANIQDLDPSLTYESSRRNTPVNCVLKLDGVLRNPTISSTSNCRAPTKSSNGRSKVWLIQKT